MLPLFSKPPNNLLILVLIFCPYQKDKHQKCLFSQSEIFFLFQLNTRIFQEINLLGFVYVRFLIMFCLTAAFSNENIDLINCAN